MIVIERFKTSRGVNIQQESRFFVDDEAMNRFDAVRFPSSLASREFRIDEHRCPSGNSVKAFSSTRPCRCPLSDRDSASQEISSNNMFECPMDAGLTGSSSVAFEDESLTVDYKATGCRETGSKLCRKFA